MAKKMCKGQAIQVNSEVHHLKDVNSDRNFKSTNSYRNSFLSTGTIFLSLDSLKHINLRVNFLSLSYKPIWLLSHDVFRKSEFLIAIRKIYVISMVVTANTYTYIVDNCQNNFPAALLICKMP